MKPIISVISILLSLGAAQAATIFSTTNINAASSAGNNYFGFATQLVSPVMSTTTSGVVATLPETVYLNSLSLDMRSGSGTGTTFKVAVYTFTADGTVGDLVGLSSNANAWADGATLTFNFNDVELTSSATYQYLFVSENTSWEDLNPTADTENMAAYRNHAVSASLSMSNNTVNLPSGTGNRYLGAAWSGRFIVPPSPINFTIISFFKGEEGIPLLPFFGEENKLIPKKIGRRQNGRIRTHNHLVSPPPQQLFARFSISQPFQHHFSSGSALRNTAYFCLQSIGIKVGSVLLQFQFVNIILIFHASRALMNIGSHLLVSLI